MIPSRRYEPSYPPPPRNTYGQNIYSAPPQHQQQQRESIQQYQQQQQHQQQQQQQHPQQQQLQQQQQLSNDGQHSQLGNQPNGGQSQQSVDGQSAAGGSGGPGSEMNLASVLHYLQSEWRRWERDRNEWEIERAEMRARIALLEGQRRSAENLKVDLLRRVKMLEFALRQERTKVSGAGTIGKAGGIAPSKLASLQEDDRASNKSDREGSDSGVSGGSDERDDDRFKTNGNHAGTSKSSSGSTKGSDTSPWKNIGSIPRDPKSRARSREYLKQCLQEITYLTSPGALNPIPSRPPITDLGQISPKTGIIEQIPERPTKSLPLRSLPSLFDAKPKEESSTNDHTMANGIKEEPQAPAPAPATTPESQEGTSTKPISPTSTDAAPAKSHLSNVETSARPPSSPLVRTKGLPGSDAESSDPDTASQDQTNQLLTAIYRPESKAAWREELQAANEKAEKSRKDRTTEPSTSADETLSNISLTAEETEVKEEDTGLPKSWVSKRMLKSHLDIVRSVAIASGPGIQLASGGDDNTVKIWSVDVSSLSSSKPASDVEPIATYRGHTAPVTSVLISSPLKLVFSASLDSSIRIWTLPEPSCDSYGPYDPSTSVQTLVGHTEAIWDLRLLPSRASFAAPKTAKDPSPRLASCSADGSVRIWARNGTTGQWTLESTINDFPQGVVPTCLSVYHSDYGKVLVGLSSGLIGLYDVETRRQVATIGSARQTSQVNCVISHPADTVIVAGYEDGYITAFDSETYAVTSRIRAHEEAVTSLILNPLSQTSVITSSTNCSIRIWDMTNHISVQDLGGHRTRGGEGVCQVVGHPDLGFLASAGADGVVRLWASA